MKKVTIVLFVWMFIANFAYSQGVAAEEAPVDITFFEIVGSSGTVGKIVWGVLFSMWPVAFVLGIFASIASAIRKTSELPLSFKYLIAFPVLYFFAGAVGVIFGMINAASTVGTLSGAKGAVAFAMSLSHILYSVAFMLMGMIPFLFFIVISLVLMHIINVPEETIETEYKVRGGDL